MLYTILKFIHVFSAIVWIGGGIAIYMFNQRLTGTGDRHLITGLTQYGQFFGARVLGPAGGITLVVGGIMMLVSHLHFALWLVWGLAAVVVSVVLGSTAMRATWLRLAAAVADESTPVSTITDAQKRLTMLNTINLLVLASAVAMMVFKPG